ncbi:MAG: chorismate synthase [Bacillota bacterium]|nr:chorismate synthase [Bacillota bacterium]
MRYLTAGDSHGPGLVVIVDGVPAGIPLVPAHIEQDLDRRRVGYGRSGRMAAETEEVQVWGGLYQGLTTGAPLGILIPNRVGARVAGPEVYRIPRPGHADLAGFLKYSPPDLQPVQERASARETAARCAAGAVARRLLEEMGVRVFSLVTGIGSAGGDGRPGQEVEDAVSGREVDWDDLAARAEASPLRCPWEDRARAMREEIDRAMSAGDTLGGTFVVVATGVPAGLGSYVQADRRLDGRLAAAVMSIPAIKGVEVGMGFALATLAGSHAHDPILPGLGRAGNRAGGLEGGVTNGQPLLVRAAMKPIPTLPGGLPSVDLVTGQEAQAPAQRADVCAVPAAAVVAEAAVAWELARAVLERYGGDRVGDIRAGLGR